MVSTMNECVLDPSRNLYEPRTFDVVRRLRDRILKVSRRIGVSPIAVAGAIADEYNAQQTEINGRRWMLDGLQDVLWAYLPEFLFDWSVRVGSESKLKNATRHDIGVGNINVATARSVYDEFRLCFRDVPEDMNAFLGDDRSDWGEVVDYVLTDEGTVVLAALVIKKAMREMASELHGRSPEIQEAILVTYFKQGARYVHKFRVRLAMQPDATLIPGEGCRVFHQRGLFLEALGLPMQRVPTLHSDAPPPAHERKPESFPESSVETEPNFTAASGGSCW